MPSAPDSSSRASNRPCPICRRPADSTLKPFCSRRCADVDLHRWLGGTYALPAEPDDEDELPGPPSGDG